VAARSVKSFPGAEGFGADAIGGRGGRLIEVTNLDDSGPGSLRAAMESSGPRICVFRVSGTITLKSPIRVRTPFLTVAGQTSPGGVQIRGTGEPEGDWGVWFVNGAHDIVLRHLRVRMGGNMKHDAGNNILCYGTAEPGVHDVIIDHCSVAWGSDTQLDWYGSFLDRATFQWNLIGECFMGQHIGGNRAPKNITLHHNLYANLGSRTPLMQHADVFDFRNNVIYNWSGNNASVFGQFALNTSAFGNVVENLWLAGPESGYPYLNVGNGGPTRIDGKAAEAGGTKLYLAGNWGPRSPKGSDNDWTGHGVNTWDFYEFKHDGSTHVVDQRQYDAGKPFPAPEVKCDPVAKLLERVLDTVGACKPSRDTVDQRIIQSVRDGKGTSKGPMTGPWPDLASRAPAPPADTDHDGIPDAWEKAHGLDPNSDRDGPTISANGYSNVENYLNELAGDEVPGLPQGAARPAAGPAAIPRFGIFEENFTQQRTYANPYTAVTADATFVQADGKERSIPLFWGGGNTWRVRFSPDTTGEWSWSIHSNDRGLDGQRGKFTCTTSTRHGGITAMKDYPYHFQHQDGTPWWMFGDTQWEAFADDPAQNLTAKSMREYFTLRAAQGFNYVHAEIIGLVRASNLDASGREQVAFHDYRAESINPAYFDNVDARLAQANALGITVGMILMEPYFTPASSIDPKYRYDNRCWMSFGDDAARLRYARYCVARYSAYNVLFLLTLEWGPAAKPLGREQCVAMFNRIGAEIQKHDPHQRLRGIHDDNGTLPNDFYGEGSEWNTLGQYCQYSGSDYQWPWCDGCTPPDDANCRGRFATPRNRHTLHDEMMDVRLKRDRNRPVIDGEYAYYLRRSVPNHPDVVNRGHSHDRATFRKAAWVLTMSGCYIVPGFWRTYYGGWAGRQTQFQPDDPEARVAVKDLQTFNAFFTQTEDGSRRSWWKLVPHDELVSTSAAGYSYCLAEPQQSYIVYAENTRLTELKIAGPADATYRVTQFDPRTARRTNLNTAANRGTITLSSPDTEDWAFEVVRN
jgi:pectate lyase